jgi:hypothetical protein
MSRKRQTAVLGITVALILSGFSCSLPFFNRNGEAGSGSGDRGASGRAAKLSGYLELGEGCPPGYYQIKLVGLFEGSENQVESQTDQTGRFSIEAPPGRYMVQVAKEGCGAKQAIELEENTEHMISVSVLETKGIERYGMPEGRLPASVLILPKR